MTPFFLQWRRKVHSEDPRDTRSILRRISVAGGGVVVGALAALALATIDRDDAAYRVEIADGVNPRRTAKEIAVIAERHFERRGQGDIVQMRADRDNWTGAITWTVDVEGRFSYVGSRPVKTNVRLPSSATAAEYEIDDTTGVVRSVAVHAPLKRP